MAMNVFHIRLNEDIAEDRQNLVGIHNGTSRRQTVQTVKLLYGLFNFLSTTHNDLSKVAAYLEFGNWCLTPVELPQFVNAHLKRVELYNGRNTHIFHLTLSAQLVHIPIHSPLIETKFIFDTKILR